MQSLSFNFFCSFSCLAFLKPLLLCCVYFFDLHFLHVLYSLTVIAIESTYNKHKLKYIKLSHEQSL